MIVRYLILLSAISFYLQVKTWKLVSRVGLRRCWIFWNFYDVGMGCVPWIKRPWLLRAPVPLARHILTRCHCQPSEKQNFGGNERQMCLKAVWRTGTDQSLSLIGDQVFSITSAWLDLNKSNLTPARPIQKTGGRLMRRTVKALSVSIPISCCEEIGRGICGTWQEM